MNNYKDKYIKYKKKYINIKNNINMIGGGDWTSFCPICGIHFYIDINENIIEEKLDYNSSKKSKNIEKIINNFNKNFRFSALGIKNNTFIKYDKITLLLPNSIIKHNVSYSGNNEFFYKKNNKKQFFDVYFNKRRYDSESIKGLPMHTECWNIAKNKLKYKLTYEDFFYNKYNKQNKINNYLFKNIDYGPASKYITQFWEDNIINLNKDNFLLNKKDWYILYKPLAKTKKSKKNFKRIKKILEKFIQGIY